MESHNALEAIAGGRWEGPSRFAARQQFVSVLSRWHEVSGGMPALLGGRIHPVPHQLYAARKALAEQWPRYLLADEVGLGKTIEAGLVIQALRSFHHDLRILVAAPGAMGRQWLCEMFVRFGEQVFALLDTGRLATDDAGLLLERGRAIVSFTALEVWPQLQQEILQRDWDLVIIDEAHQVQSDSDLYQFLHRLSAASKGVLALSATPSRRDLDGLCGVLALVDPAQVQQHGSGELSDRIARGEGLERIICSRRAEVAVQGTKLCRRELKALSYPVPQVERDAIASVEAHPQPGDDLQAALAALYRQTATGSPVVALQLLERRRKVLQGEIQIEEVPVGTPVTSLSGQPGPEEEEHLWDQVVSCASPLPGEEEWLQAAVARVRRWLETTVGGSARFRAVSDWIQSLLDKDSNAKVLVFAGDGRLVEDFEDHLSERLGHQRLARIHYRLDEVTLAHEALRFQQQHSCAVLISDELGGEGRNFQFATAVVHLDLPWSPARLEQRIGRLDRMGRDANRAVLSVVPCGSGRTEAALFSLHGTSFDIFRRSLGGLEFLLAPLHAKICAAFLAGPEQLELLSEEIAADVSEERAKADRAPGLNATDPRCLEEATRQASLLSSVDGEQDKQAICEWVQLLGGRCEPAARGGMMLGWDKSRLRRALDAVPGSRVRRIGTFQRRQALRDESLEFFAPGHPVIDQLVRDLLISADGRACAVVRDLGALQAGSVFLVVTGWTGPAPDRLAAPHELVRSQQPQWPRLQQRVVQLGGEPKLVEDDELIAGVTAAHTDSDTDLDPQQLVILLDELHAAYGLATQSDEPLHFDSAAIVVGRIVARLSES